ncbi:MAG: flavin reductase family protein [Elusimicrobiota bacterium]
MKILRAPVPYLFPVPVVLVSCRTKDGLDNIITIAWAGNICSEPPMISISIRPSRFSYRIIKASGEFAVNIPSREMLEKVDWCGTHSGRDFDKFKETGWKKLTAQKIAVSLIEECPVNLECRVKSSYLLGTHEIFLAEILNIQIEESCLDEENRIIVKKIEPISYIGHQYFSIQDKLGDYGFVLKK